MLNARENIKKEYDEIVSEIHKINLKIVELLNKVEEEYGLTDYDDFENHKIWQQVSSVRNWNVYKAPRISDALKTILLADNDTRLEERIKKIENKAIENKRQEAEVENKQLEKNNLLKERFKELAPRISDILVLANKCIENGIGFPELTEKYGYGEGFPTYNFKADGIYHRVGFMGYRGNNNPKKIEYLGIYAGGACGPWHFYTNGMQTFLHSDTDAYHDANNGYMEKFLKDFDSFESAFYNWIDSLF